MNGAADNTLPKLHNWALNEPVTGSLALSYISPTRQFGVVNIVCGRSASSSHRTLSKQSAYISVLGGRPVVVDRKQSNKLPGCLLAISCISCVYNMITSWF